MYFAPGAEASSVLPITGVVYDMTQGGLRYEGGIVSHKVQLKRHILGVRFVQSTAAAQNVLLSYIEAILCDSPQRKRWSVHKQKTIVPAYS